MPVKTPVEVELRGVPHRRHRDGVVGLRCLIVEVDDEVDVLACHPLPRRPDDMAEFIEFDHPHADEFGSSADPLHALVLSAGLLRPHADHGDRAFDSGQARDGLLRLGDRATCGRGCIGGGVVGGFH